MPLLPPTNLRYRETCLKGFENHEKPREKKIFFRFYFIIYIFVLHSAICNCFKQVYKFYTFSFLKVLLQELTVHSSLIQGIDENLKFCFTDVNKNLNLMLHSSYVVLMERAPNGSNIDLPINSTFLSKKLKISHDLSQNFIRKLTD